MSELTNVDFWDEHYKSMPIEAFNPTEWRNYVCIQLVRRLMNLGLEGRRVLEIGGGGAQILAWLAKQYPTSYFVALDYSEVGCQIARRRAKLDQLQNLEVVCADMFNPPKDLLSAFDLVFSLGVVEHFTDLVSALKAKTALLTQKGLMFTVIPNLVSPIYRYLCRRWSMRVWNLHVAHSLCSLVEAHRKAGLEVVDSGYIGSLEFGMLSMAAKDVEGNRREWLLYLWLTRFSKALHWFEFHFFELPETSLFSPFMFVTARRL